MNRLKLNLQLFWQGAVLSYIGLFHWLRPGQYIATKVWGPLTYMVFFTLLGRYASGNDDASFYVIGNALQTIAFSGIYGVTMSVGGDREFGTLPYLFGSPADRFLMFTGRSVMHILDGILGAVIGFAWGVLILGLDLSQANLPTLALIILVASFSTSGMGMLMGCLSLVTRNVMFVNNTVFFLLLVFTGANIEITRMPTWAQAVAQVLPLTRAIAAARRVAAGGSLAAVGDLLTVEFLLGLAYMLAGFFLFRWFEYVAKRRDTLEAF
jgi:ABC-2 type transport system permease protein